MASYKMNERWVWGRYFDHLCWLEDNAIASSAEERTSLMDQVRHYARFHGSCWSGDPGENWFRNADAEELRELILRSEDPLLQAFEVVGELDTIDIAIANGRAAKAELQRRHEAL